MDPEIDDLIGIPGGASLRKSVLIALVIALPSATAVAEPTVLSCTFNHKTSYVWTYVLDLSKKLMVLAERNDEQTSANIPIIVSDTEIQWTAYINNGRDPTYYTLDRTTLRLKLVNTFDKNHTYFYDCNLARKQM